MTTITESLYSEEAERLLLGAMLASFSNLNRALDFLDADSFFLAKHKLIFSVICGCYKNDQEVDPFIVSERLKEQGQLESVGGRDYLLELAEGAGTSVYILGYAKIVNEKALLRRLLSAVDTIKQSVYAPNLDVADILSEAQGRLFAISQGSLNYENHLVKDLLTKGVDDRSFLEALQHQQKLFRKAGNNAAKVVGIPTNFYDLDRLIQGFRKSNLMILAGRPGMGKTALALNLAENICFKNSVPVALFSLEMSADQLLTRMVSSYSEVEATKIVSGSLNNDEYQNVVVAVNEMKKHTMIIDDHAGLKITDLRARARRLKEVYNIGFIVIDYLQLLSGSGTMRSTESRQLEVSEISRLLKTLARELDIPILCLSQLSRKVEERHNHRPMLSDLRESGCLHGDTKIIDADTQKEYTIAELANRAVAEPMNIYAIDQTNNLGIYSLTKAFFSGEKQLFLVHTVSKKMIKATANHKFKTQAEWLPLAELKVGDKIATRSKEGVVFEAIDMIEPLGIEAVYDATVDVVHNFVANGIVVHNSIEQDSDLIMLLLRHDYYNEEDRPGEVELNVAKNRHGPIGAITLLYRKEIIRFDNYSK